MALPATRFACPVSPLVRSEPFSVQYRFRVCWSLDRCSPIEPVDPGYQRHFPVASPLRGGGRTGLLTAASVVHPATSAAGRRGEIERLYRTRYRTFTARLFHDYLVRDHLYQWSYTWTKLFLHRRVCWTSAAAPRAPAQRPLRPLPVTMLHQAGSRHAWLEGQPAIDLIVTMDDATSDIYSAFLVEKEGTASTFQALFEVSPATAFR